MRSLLHSLHFAHDVAVLAGVRRPMMIGFESDEIRRMVTIDNLTAVE
ncbi:MAG: hypothetical protein V7K14_18470 [Nostoc sp.]